jgi:hypothetical protein
MATEQKVSPIDPSTLSWRDKTRNLMRLKYGETGENFTEALIGKSEEEKNMIFQERVRAGLTPAPETDTGSRPISDMFKSGVSDFGLMDLSLMAISAGRIPTVSSGAALTESSILGADAVGEYNKGNTGTAAVMGTLAGVPPLLRYANPIAKTSSKEVAEKVEDIVDPTRRNLMQGMGLAALAAPFSDPLIMAGRKLVKPPVLRGVAKLTPSIPNVAISDVLNVGSDAIVKITRNLAKDLKNPNILDADIGYPIGDIIFKLEDLDVSKLSPLQINKIFVDEAKRVLPQYLPEVQKELFEILTSESYIKNILNTMENVKSTLRNDPAIKNGLDRISKLDNMSEEEIAKTFNNKGMDTVYYDISDDIQEAMAKHSF